MIAAQKRNLNHVHNMSVLKNKALWASFLTVGLSARVAAAHTVRRHPEFTMLSQSNGGCLRSQQRKPAVSQCRV